MRTFKLTSVFALGLICGLLMQWPSASAYDDRGGIAGGSGGGGGIASSCTADIAPPGGDGMVNVGDLLAVINAWGACPVPCDSSGTWVNAVAPAYQCAGGIVNFNIPQWTFTQTGSTLTVTVSDAGLLDVMSGTITDCESGGTFTVAKVLSASCTTTYTLSGAFSSPTQFTGTFTVTFTGFGCQNCTNHTFNISASRQ